MWTHSTGIVELWIWLSFECEWNDDDDVVVDTQQFHIIFKLHIITAGHCFLFFRSISQISICCLGCGWVRMEYTMHSICTVHTLAIVELRSVPLTFVSSAHLLLLLSCVGRETHSRKTHIETAHCTFLVRINVYLMNCRWRQRSSHKHLDIRNQHSHFCSQKANRECVCDFFLLSISIHCTDDGDDDDDDDDVYISSRMAGINILLCNKQNAICILLHYGCIVVACIIGCRQSITADVCECECLCLFYFPSLISFTQNSK